MALDPVPWGIGKGAHNSVEGARLSLYAATNGATGVMRPLDMRVTALPVPGDAVRVHTGAGVAVSRYPGASSQSYAVRETSSSDVEIDATGSSGSRTRYLVVRVSDHQYTGEPTPTDVKNGPYNHYEWLASDPWTNPPAFPVVPLAQVVQPANTATITQAMITDIRRVANPRTWDVWRPRASVREDTEELTAYQDGDGEWFPNAGGEQRVLIPEDATRVQIAATWMGVRIDAGKNGWGEYWVEFGPFLRQSVREFSTQRYQWDTVGTTATAYREPWIMEDDRYIPERIRGTTQPFIMKALRSPDSDNAVAKIDFKSGVSLKLRFLEIADPSTS